jgi:hypothetical protein
MAGAGVRSNLDRMTDQEQARRTTPPSAMLHRSYVQHIEAAPEGVFPLLCPVREGEWLDGWSEHCEVIWTVSGLAETGCVFRTTEPDGPETIWIITEYDPDRGVVVFARVTEGLAASTLRILVEGAGQETSAVTIRYSVVPLSPAGAIYAAARYDETDLLASIAWWERSMNYYLRTGELLRRTPHATQSTKE